jgi:hypothetical protein
MRDHELNTRESRMDNRLPKALTGLLVSALAAITLGGFASPAQADDGFTYTTADSKVTVKGCVGTCPTDLVIPETLGGNPVTTIDGAAFSQKRLTSVTLPSSLISIGGNAFSNNLLTTVTIPNLVTTISSAAFGANNLTSVSLGNSVTDIGVMAFGSNKLTSITLTQSVTTIGGFAFYDNELTSVLFTGNAPTEGSDVFGSNSALTSVTARGYATGWGATWSGVPVNMQRFRFDTSDNDVEIHGLWGCPSNLVLPATLDGNPVKSIRAWFLGNAECSPTALTVPASVTTIGAGAFAYAKFSSVNFLGNAPTEIAGVFDVNAASFIDVPYGATGYGATWSGIPVRYGPAPVVAPVYVDGGKLSGKFNRVGTKLTADAGTWNSAVATSKKYAWYVCTKNVASTSKTGRVAAGCKAISKATKNTYVISAEMKKKFIAVKITVTNSRGSASIFTQSTRSVGTW